VAAEMAAELAADLEEADAEGVAAAEVLGIGSSDPREFATVWAAERGVVERPSTRGRHRPLVSPAVVALALLAVLGAVLVIRAPAPQRPLPTLLTPPGPGAKPVRVARSPSANPSPPRLAPTRLIPQPGRIQVTPGGVWVTFDAADSAKDGTHLVGS